MNKKQKYNFGRTLIVEFDTNKTKAENMAAAINQLKQQLQELANMPETELAEIAKKQYYKMLVELDE